MNKNLTLTLSKKYGNLWMLEDVTPFYKPFMQHFIDEMGNDTLKLTTCGVENSVLDILADGAGKMELELVMADNRAQLPGYIEFELATPGTIASRYYVNNCPGHPRLEAWINTSIRQIIGEPSPAFAYIRKKD